MEALIILGAILLIVLMIFVAQAFQDIAEMKGHSSKKYFWWTLFLSVVGMLMVVALPDLKARGGASPVAEKKEPEEAPFVLPEI